MTQMVISSTAFADSTEIPARYTGEGEDISPPLVIAGVPPEAKSLALIVSDRDAPGGVWVHWVMWNMDPQTVAIPENSVPTGAVEGTNSWGRRSYGGPCPLRGSHRYFIHLYALSDKLDLPTSISGRSLERAMRGKILATAELMGVYAHGKVVPSPPRD